MPCLLAILAVAFPRVAIVLLWLFTNFFSVLHSNILVPLLGFIFLPLTLIVYTYVLRAYGGTLGITQLVFIFVAVILDLGLVGGGAWRSRG
jgi:hypothetical protein